MTGIFDISSPLEFFESIRRIYARYNSSTAKEVEDLLYVLMGLNHLREWVAPGYDRKKGPETLEEKFHDKIWNECPSFEIINALCNRTKHLQPIRKETSYACGIPIDEWPYMDAVKDMDSGPASNYFVDGNNIIKIVDEVIKYYEDNWFSAGI